MIDPAMFLAFVAATTILMLIPGPNVALIVSNSVAYGSRYGLITVGGTSSAMMVQLAIAAFGMTEALRTLGHWFEWLRWIGVAYLIYLGVTHWRAPAADLTRTAPEPKSARAIYSRALPGTLICTSRAPQSRAHCPKIVPGGSPYLLARQLLRGVVVKSNYPSCSDPPG